MTIDAAVAIVAGALVALWLIVIALERDVRDQSDVTRDLTERIATLERQRKYALRMRHYDNLRFAWWSGTSPFDDLPTDEPPVKEEL